jgi:hypothetical protein
MSMQSLMNTTVTIQQEVETKSAAGFTTRAWSDLTADIPARVQNLSMDAILVYGRLGLLVSDVIYFNVDPELTGVENNRRIVWPENGNKYYPKNIKNAGGNINRVWQVIVDRDRT